VNVFLLCASVCEAGKDYNEDVNDWSGLGLNVMILTGHKSAPFQKNAHLLITNQNSGSGGRLHSQVYFTPTGKQCTAKSLA